MDKRDLCPGTTLRRTGRAFCCRSRRQPGRNKENIADFVHKAPRDAPSLGDIFRACSVRAGIWKCARCVLSEGGVVFYQAEWCFYGLFCWNITLFLQDVLSSRGGSEGDCESPHCAHKRRSSPRLVRCRRRKEPRVLLLERDFSG